MEHRELYHRLKDLRSLKPEIERHQERIRDLEAIATSVTAKFSQTPKGNGKSDKVGSNAAAIADLKQELNELVVMRINEERELLQYINEISEARIRLMVELYYLDWKSWNEIAARVGGGNSEDSCRKAVSRYFEKRG